MIRFIILFISALATVNSRYDMRRIKPIVGGRNQTEPLRFFASVCGINRWGEKDCHCGASFVTTRILLTAAHCVESLAISDLIVYWGSIYRNRYIKEWAVESVIPYLPPTRDQSHHDLAVIVLHGEADINDGIQLIEYPTKWLLEGERIHIYGHGHVEPNKPSHLLKQAAAQVVYPTENSVCKTLMNDGLREDQSRGMILGEAHFCATSPRAGVCKGDSGGPVNAGASLEQVAVIRCNFDNCAQVHGKYYGLLIDIHFGPYVEWIQFLKNVIIAYT